MPLKDLFCQIIKKQSYDLSGVDTSVNSRRELIAYIFDTYSDDVEDFNILDLHDNFLDELIDGEDLTLKVSAALSKLDRAIPHLQLRSYV